MKIFTFLQRQLQKQSDLYLVYIMKYLTILTTKNPQTQTSSTPYLLSTLTSVLYPFSWIYCNEQNLSISENAILRGLACTIIHYILCLLTDSSTNIPDPKSFKLLILRSLIMSVYSIVISLAQFILPLPIVHTINSSTLIFVFIIDYFVNGVKINFQQTLGVCVGLVGVLAAGNSKIINSWIDSEYNQTSQFKHYITGDLRFIGVFMIFFMAMMFACAYAIVLTKNIKANTYQINFFMGIVIQFSGVFMYPFTKNNANYTQIILGILLTGIPLSLGQTIYIAALRMSRNAGLVSITGFVTVGISYLISIFRYHEKPNVVTSLGVGLALFGVWRTIFGRSSS